MWLDHARELSERWIHRQQILQALDRPSDLRADLAGPVLDGLRWAYPFRLASLQRAPGTTVGIMVTGPEVEVRWALLSDGDVWRFTSAEHVQVGTELQMTTEQAWRILTNNFSRDIHGDLVVSGDHQIIETLAQTRAIIGAPK